MENENVVYTSLYKAYCLYRKAVVDESVVYERYVSLFLASNGHRQENETESDFSVRMDHVRELLVNRPKVAKYFFDQAGLTIADMAEIVDVINKTKKGGHVAEQTRKKTPRAKVHCVNMDNRILAEVTKFANAHEVFKETLTPTLLSDFFSEKKGVLHAKVNKVAALFFTALENAELTIGFGPTDIGNRANLMRHKGERPMLADDFYPNRSLARNANILQKWVNDMKAIKAGGTFNPEDKTVQ